MIRQAALAATAATLGVAPLAAGPDTPDIPPRAMTAYTAAAERGGCPWWIIATVGWLETDHGRIGGDGLGGIFTTHLGPDGKQVRESWSDAAAGGPMGWLPTSWEGYAADGDGDGDMELTDIDDAAVGTCALLKANGFTADDPETWDRALGMYNGGPGCWDRCRESLNYRSKGMPYALELADVDPGNVPQTGRAPGKDRSLGAVAERWWGGIVRGWLTLGGRADGPARQQWQRADDALFGPGATPSDTAVAQADDPTLVERCGVTAQAWLADVWCRMVDDAAAEGVTLAATSSYRSSELQAELRRSNGCPDMTSSASACAVPTAPVGSSNHEAGAAIDVAGLPGAWAWIGRHAATYGLRVNDQAGGTEPWHLSRTGM